MPHPGKSARSSASYDWSASAVGDPSRWPSPLRMAAQFVFNTPLPILLLWGADSIVLHNDAYAALAGRPAPGGNVPPVWPAPLAAAGGVLARAWRGEALLLASQQLDFGSGDTLERQAWDLYLTPVQDEAGQVQGVLCALAAAAPDDAHPHSEALRILVVEDNLDSQYLVCEMLKAFGHEAEGVGHPDDALARLAAQRYDVLFSDVSLPGMSGVDLARIALQNAPALKVIFASGYGDTLLRHLDFPYLSLQKPYELDQLQTALANIAAELRARG